MRAAAVHRTVLGVTLSLLAVALVLAAAALAAKPKRGARFSGHTASQPVVGFLAPVNFTVAQDGASLKGFSFGSFGCEGAGGFRPGVNPYTGSSILRVGKVNVTASGRFFRTGAKSSYRIAGTLAVTTISVSGRFTKAKAATGTITFAQKYSGSFNSSCGPAKIGFSASGH